jgi:hypothetical protein
MNTTNRLFLAIVALAAGTSAAVVVLLLIHTVLG